MKLQREIVLNHLQKKKSLTSWDAIQKYNITRLAAVILKLKDRHNIMSVRQSGEGKHWVKYVYMGENK